MTGVRRAVFNVSKKVVYTSYNYTAAANKTPGVHSVPIYKYRGSLDDLSGSSRGG